MNDVGMAHMIFSLIFWIVSGFIGKYILRNFTRYDTKGFLLRTFGLFLKIVFIYMCVSLCTLTIIYGLFNCAKIWNFYFGQPIDEELTKESASND